MHAFNIHTGCTVSHQQHILNGLKVSSFVVVDPQGTFLNKNQCVLSKP